MIGDIAVTEEYKELLLQGKAPQFYPPDTLIGFLPVDITIQAGGQIHLTLFHEGKELRIAEVILPPDYDPSTDDLTLRGFQGFIGLYQQ